MKIKSPIPLTVALLSSHLADQVYDKALTLSDALDQTGCKERWRPIDELQLHLQCRQWPADFVHPSDIDFSGHKKAGVEVNTVKYVEHCELLDPPANP